MRARERKRESDRERRGGGRVGGFVCERAGDKQDQRGASSQYTGLGVVADARRIGREQRATRQEVKVRGLLDGGVHEDESRRQTGMQGACTRT